MWIEIIVVLALFLLNGVFSMAEIAIVSSRKIRLEGMAKRGSKGAQAALDLSEDPTRFLSTVQVGITLIGVLTGFYTGSVFSDNVAAWLISIGLPEAYAAGSAIVLVLLITTYLSLVLGELVPKKIGLLDPEGIASSVAIPMQVLSKVSAPVVTLLTGSTNFLVKLFRLKPGNENEVTEEEVKSLIAQGTSSGTFEKIEQNLVERVFHFSDRNVGSLMTNRSQLEWVDVEEDQNVVLEELKRTEHSHLLLCQGDLDEVLGTIKVKEALKSILNDPATHFDWQAVLEKPLYVPDTMGVLRMVEKLRERKQHLAVVVNEFGAVEGVITQTDVFNGLLIDLDTVDEQERQIVQRADGSYLVNGSMPFADFVSYFQLENTSESIGFHTVAGFFLAHYKQIPTPGDVVEWQNLRMEVMDLDGKRIDKILLTTIAPADPAA